MTDWRDRPARRHDDITISAIRVAFVLSLLVHAAALWTYLPKLQLRTPSDSDQVDTSGNSPLAVKLMPPSVPPGSMPETPPPAPVRAPEATARSASPPPTATLRPPSRPPVLAAAPRAPNVPTVPIAPPESKPSPQPQPTDAPDLAAYIEARRRARGDAAPGAQQSASETPPVEDENARRNRIVAANLGMGGRQTFGNPKNGGGVFQIKTMEYDYAEFYFFGWNKDIGRNAKQVIEVRKAANADIRIAIVRKMIGIVREYESGDFQWESHRLGRQLTLSARARDNTELESFMMQEFFYDEQRRPPP